MSTEHRVDREFSRHAFLVSDAMRRGYGPGVFAHRRWNRPFCGVRSKETGGATLRDRALQYLPRLRPGELFSHATALALLGCPIRVPRGAAVDVSSPQEMGRVRCAGVLGHRHAVGAPEYECALPEYDERIPVVSPLLAVQQAAGTLPFPELVVALDYLLRPDSKRYDPYAQVRPDELARFAAETTGRGGVRLRVAAALARVGAESRMETLLRLGAVRVGLPEMRIQLDLRDARGDRIGRFDAADLGTRSLYEYDGEQHFYSRAQRRRDPKKHQAARDAGWRILVLYSEDFSEGLLPVGLRIMEFCGREAGVVPASLARLLDEFSGEETESAVPLPAQDDGYFRP